MNKRFTLVMTTLILSVFVSISASAYDVEVDGIYYNIVEKTKKAEVTFGDTKPEGDIVIPSIIKIENDDYDVTSIGYKAFSGCYYIKSVTIPSSVTYIDSQAFWHCNELSYLSLSKTIIKLGDQVFDYCKNLSKVEIPDISVWMSIDFNGTVNNPLWYGADLYINGEKLTNLIVPEDIISIKDFSFQGCNSLEKVVLHNGINLIGRCSFEGCKN